MKYNLLSIVFLVVFVTQARANTNTLCDTINHVPNDDVTYRHSPNVVPADLNAVPISLGDVEIPLTAYLVQELGLTIPISAMKLGSVTVKENGSVMYQGKDISSNAQTACGKNTNSKDLPLKTPETIIEKKEVKKDPANDRQVSVEPVKSSPLPKQTSNQDSSIRGGFGQDHINGTYND